VASNPQLAAQPNRLSFADLQGAEQGPPAVRAGRQGVREHADRGRAGDRGGRGARAGPAQRRAARQPGQERGGQQAA